jgi:O-antigen/teichoic acid export membrane protein
MFSFGWKILAAGLLNTIYTELNSLVIGKRYSSADLAYYSKGSQMPRVLVTGVDTSIRSVVFSALSKKQNDMKALHTLLFKAININSYVLFFCLGTLAVIAKPLVVILLTEKWLSLLPFLYICCFTMAFHPVASAQVQAITAVGRSDMRLVLEVLKKSIGILLLIAAVYLDYGPIGVAVSAAIASILSVMIGAIGCRITTKYPLRNIIRDIFPILTITAVMDGLMFPLINALELNVYLATVLGGVGCTLFYWGISAAFKIYGYGYLKSIVFNNQKVSRFLHTTDKK